MNLGFEFFQQHAVIPADASYQGEFTISAVPEPQSVALLLAGIGMMAAAVAWRRQTS